MNVLFVNYHDFRSNSAIHIFNLANELAGFGIDSAVCVPDGAQTVELLGEPRFRILDFTDALGRSRPFADGRGPSLVHAWTPRENVRSTTEELVRRYSCPYVVHLEDNEDVVTASSLGVAPAALANVPERTLDGLLRRTEGQLAHPRRYREFLAGASGITAIVDTLLELRPDGVPAQVIWPAFEHNLFSPRPPDDGLRRELGLSADEFVIVYPGNAHGANMTEMRSLYLAVGLVNRRGLPLRLVRLGEDHADFLGEELATLKAHVVEVGVKPHHEIPRYLALADVLVQPGRADPFNDYRFPAKLPEFFAMGKPVVLPRTNIGRFLRDGEECLLLDEGHAIEIAQTLERLLPDRALRERLGQAARCFAEERFAWSASARRLHELYLRVLAEGDSTPSVLESVRARYSPFAPPALGYATVRDYCDSAQNLPELATVNGDMKDVQRPWALKAIIGRVPRGGRLLEIGAGHPLVASALAGLGYDVVVIDPYDGRNRGPDSFDAIQAAHPAVRFVRGLFPQDLRPEHGSFDCIYSISVLEHLPEEGLDEACEAVFRLLAPGGWSIHAVDHVHRGRGSEQHLAKLRRIAAAHGITEAELDSLLERIDGDPDAYFLSAEAHNRWRGSTPYEDFPMRRCVSVQLCVPPGGAKAAG